MLDFNDFQPMGEPSNPGQNQSESNQLDMNNMNDMFMNSNNPQIDEEEQKRIADRQKEAEERKEKINQKIQKEAEKSKEKINQKIKKEAELRLEITKKAAEYLAEFETQRQEQIAKRRKELEEKEANPNKGDNANGTADSWSKVSGNIDLKDSDYKGSKDVQRMREAMMHRKEDPNSEPMKNFFG